MTPNILRLKLKSVATFGRGDGVAGLVDIEIERDRHGFPYLRGKTLKGLLVESAENVIYALERLQGQDGWQEIRDILFGKSGRGLKERGILHIGDACLPEQLRKLFINELAKKDPTFSPDDILYSLTGIRHQTGINPNGAPDPTSLRSMRVLLKETVLESALIFEDEPSDRALELLAAAVMDFRRAGTGRNRGRGWLIAELDNDQTTQSLFDKFAKAVNP